MFLQVDTTALAQGTERFFQTSPDTVYGLLTGALAIAVVALFGVFIRFVNKYQANLTDVVLKSAEAMSLVGNNLDKLRDASEDDIASIKEGFDRLRTEVLQKLDTLAKK